jgi:hypothetical protein
MRGMAAMAMVLITCPKTRRPVATGLELDTMSFIWSTLREQRFHCSACGRTHVWDKEDAYLPPHPPKPPPGRFRRFAGRRQLTPDASALERGGRIPWHWLQAVAAGLIIVAAWFLAVGPGTAWFAGLLQR